MTNVRNIIRVGSRALAIVAVLRQLRQAREDGDKLVVLDAVVNALAVLTAVAIIVREIRRRSDDTAAVEEAPL